MRYSFSALAIVAALMAAVMFSNRADASVTLEPGQTLDVYFDFPGGTTFSEFGPSYPLDTLSFNLEDYSVYPATATATAALYNGGTLLGTIASFNADIDQTFAFEGSTSKYTAGATDVIDFSSIADGTIDGLLQIQLVGDASANDLVIYTNGFGTGAYSNTIYDVASTDPQITSEVVVPNTPIPEPTSLAILGAALIGFGFLYHRRDRAWRKVSIVSAE